MVVVVVVVVVVLVVLVVLVLVLVLVGALRAARGPQRERDVYTYCIHLVIIYKTYVCIYIYIHICIHICFVTSARIIQGDHLSKTTCLTQGFFRIGE